MNIGGPSTVDEGDATSNYTVSLSPSGVKPTADLTVSYATADGTASSSDYTAKSGTLTFTKYSGRCADVHGADDRGHDRRGDG